ncbi:MAG: transketolase [Deltaproteobacteria bacterium]|nr:transketolase [Deltaproteobacteria bacterium]
MNAKYLEPRHLRELIVEQCKLSNVGHIGSALSVVEIMSVLYSHILRIKSFADNDRDRFILSKGHAAITLYAILYMIGSISIDELRRYCSDESMLGVHPDHVLESIDFSTGSLGHGLSYGVGSALAARLQGSSRRAFVLISDAECNEGSVWEAALFAAHHKLSNLITIVDYNGQQAFGYTDEVLSLMPICDKWRAFGWRVEEVDGHSTEELIHCFERIEEIQDRPKIIIAHTISGKGVSYMEGLIKWHYWPMSDNEFDIAKKELAFFE